MSQNLETVLWEHLIIMTHQSHPFQLGKLIKVFYLNFDVNFRFSKAAILSLSWVVKVKRIFIYAGLIEWIKGKY